jgi:hypothetical protein
MARSNSSAKKRAREPSLERSEPNSPGAEEVTELSAAELEKQRIAKEKKRIADDRWNKACVLLSLAIRHEGANHAILSNKDKKNEKARIYMRERCARKRRHSIYID